MSDKLKARCYCGQVEWNTTAKEGRAGYCHCADCRRAHAAPLYQVVYVRNDTVRFDKGEELLKWHSTAPDVLKRYFCSNCGTRTHNISTRGGVALTGLFASTFDDAKAPLFTPQAHANIGESIILPLIADVGAGVDRLQRPMFEKFPPRPAPKE